MKLIRQYLSFQILLFGISSLCYNGFSQSKGDLGLPAGKKIPVIELRGNGYERGFQHGKQLKNEIAEVFEKWKKNIALNTHTYADSLIAKFLRSTNFEPAIKKWTPEILDEVKGISDGSGQKYNDVYAFQLVDEFWVYLDRLKNIDKSHCSGIGISSTKNHPAYIAQNMDLENFMNGYQILLHIPGTKTGPEQYIFTCAGFIVTTGMNENGIGVCVNTLMELEASQDGLPVAFIIRAILNKHNGNEALAFFKTVKHASGQNYIIGIQDSVYDFEASANQIVRFHPEGEPAGIIYHTNHALVNHDVKSWYYEYHKKVLSGETKNMNSEIRFEALEKKVAKSGKETSSEIIKAALKSKDNEENPICRTYKEEGAIFTFGSVLYTLTGKHSVQVTYGPPDISDYQEYFFTK